MKALVVGTEVVDVVGAEFEVHEDGVWMDAPPGCKAGWVLYQGNLVPEHQTITADELAARNMECLREYRDDLLKQTDWWVMPDRSPTEEQLAYRQALRDITKHYTSREDVVWPEKPL